MECYNNRGRFLIEAILWWLIIALPINLASIFFSIQAPAYIHTDHINNGTNNFNTSLIPIMISYSKIQFAVELVSKELNHLAAILHVYAGGLNSIK